MFENKFGFDIKWFIKNRSDLNIWTRQERWQQQNERKLMLKLYVDCMLEEAKSDQAGISLLWAVGTEIQQPFSSSSKKDVNYNGVKDSEGIGWHLYTDILTNKRNLYS